MTRPVLTAIQRERERETHLHSSEANSDVKDLNDDSDEECEG